MKVENSYMPLFVTNHKYSAEQKKGAETSSTGKANVSFSIDDQKSLIRQHFGQTQDSAEWDPRADLNGDGIINVMIKLRSVIWCANNWSVNNLVKLPNTRTLILKSI